MKEVKLDHPIVKRLDVAIDCVLGQKPYPTSALLIQTRDDCVALLEQLAVATAEIERLKRASAITNFQAFVGHDSRIHVHVESDAGAVGDFTLSDNLMQALRESVVAP